MEKTINPQMVRLARQWRGLTQADLAHRIGLTQGALSQIEQGVSRASGEALQALGRELRVPAEFLCQQENVYGVAAPLRRARSGLNKRSRDLTEAKANVVRIHLKRLFQSADIRTDVTMPELDLVAENMTASDAARAVRRALRVPKGPITNLVALLESAGVLVHAMDFGTTQFDGFTIAGDEHAVIFINRAAPGDRVRFTLAHETGHIVMHRLPSDRMEDEANEFAAELLVPAEEVRPSLSGDVTLRRLADLKRYWGVSMQMLLQRAKRLGTLDEARVKALWMQMSRRGYRTKEPVEVPVEQPRLVSDLIDFHLANLDYTRTTLAGLLCINQDEMEELYGKGERRLFVVRN